MRGIEGLSRGADGLRWLGVGVVAWLFKQGYAHAEAAQLQGLLYPLAMLLNTVSPLEFVRLPTGEWWDASHHLVIVKACAGGNFLLISWLGHLWQWRQRPWGLARWWGTAAVAAWGTVLVANALRVLSIAYVEEGLIEVSGLSASDSHRLLGIVVYFAVLLVQMAGALPMAVLMYLGVVVLLPVLRMVWHGTGADTNPLIWNHVGWSIALPVWLWATAQAGGLFWRMGFLGSKQGALRQDRSQQLQHGHHARNGHQGSVGQIKTHSPALPEQQHHEGGHRA